jgi:alpha-mannosidase
MSVRRGHAGPGLETPGAQLEGSWIYEYAVIPHAGDWKEAYQQAYAFQTPLRGVETGLHEGENPNEGSFISHSPSEFVISAVKGSEDGKGWLVRGFNISDKPIQLELKPLRKYSHAVLVNLAEEDIQQLDYSGDGSISIPAAGHQILTILFKD